ncbi:MAG: GAP family protein [Streptosporangiaceae bacterium]
MYEQAAGLAALAALYPPALLIAAVYLGSASPRTMALLYLAGAVLVTAVSGAVILVVLRAGGLSLPAHRTPRYGLRLGLGALAIVAAGCLTGRERRRRRQAPAAPKKPGLISRMAAQPRPLTAVAAGLLLFVPGVGFVAAVQVIATGRAGLAATTAGLVLVVAIDIVFAWLPLAVHLIAPDRTTRALKAVNGWLGAHGRVVLIGAVGAIGVILVVNGAIGVA